MSTYKNILLTGGSGRLGSHIRASKLFSGIGIVAPTRREMDLCDGASVDAFIKQHSFQSVIHCAAMARMKQCEENPGAALMTNVVGTAHVVNAVIGKERREKKSIRFIHISTDGVYAGVKGHYTETDETIPYNTYGWTKLGAECAVRMLSNYCIVRTSFFDPKQIPFAESAEDAFSSKMTLEEMVKALHELLNHSYVGVLNVGSEKRSDYERFRAYKPELKPCKFDDILRAAQLPMAKDASLNCDRWKGMQLQ